MKPAPTHAAPPPVGSPAPGDLAAPPPPVRFDPADRFIPIRAADLRAAILADALRFGARAEELHAVLPAIAQALPPLVDYRCAELDIPARPPILLIAPGASRGDTLEPCRIRPARPAR